MSHRIRRTLHLAAWIAAVLGALLPAGAHAAEVSPVGARAIAKEAYVYGLPLVMNYKAIYLSAVWKESPSTRRPFNQIKNMARVSTPEDKAIVAPNADTPYSWAYLES